MWHGKGWATLTPGTMDSCALALDLFGLDRVDPGSWMTPVWVRIDGLTSADLHAAQELLAEFGLKLEACRG